ncbi:helix-turn-helix transcriptional regulator [Clostridium baratii]|uniref:helix-turn-helix transcriptional regulator n=1 Tax=Clostridium baratii TaxID=1561 RepID=UPI0028FDF713|nr:helix-turn-helix transcriptional regulator [Clostridium baratii]MDU1052624.1 helix-turn-helix transcriptional regulator [Clostridium baratii]
MEILSTGEKIKRSRIYKGVTLKELCANEISISKMSCIENGKVKADKDILKYIADKLELDYDYLAKDVYEQIIENIDLFEGKYELDEQLEKDIKLNLEYAVDYEYFTLAFELTHKLFNYYLKNNKLNDILDIIPRYYDLYRRNNVYENTIMYFRDMGNYLYYSKEFREAVTYYRRVLDTLIEDNNIKEELYVSIRYRKGMCYLKCGEYNLAKEHIDIAKENIKYVIDNKLKYRIYYASSLISIFLGEDVTKEEVDMAYKYAKESDNKISEMKLDFAQAYFKMGQREKALEEINGAVEILPNDDLYRLGKFFVNGVKLLKVNEIFDMAEDFADKAINIAIELNHIELIEQSYYLKGMLLQKQERYVEAELYMNLSLDSLVKFGTRKDLYSRYIDMANMYHKINDTHDSIKYFTLAMKMQKKI